MTSDPTSHGAVLWMEHEGRIYSPETSLRKATREDFEDSVWKGGHPGVCRAVYQYGAYPNGGSYCRAITSEIARNLARRSLVSAIVPIEAVRAFLESEGEDYFRQDEEVAALHGRATRLRPNAVPRTTPAVSPRKRARKLSPEELRAQPQFKLPISGGKKKDNLARRSEAEHGRCSRAMLAD
jgi:hypothetical protein